MIETALMAIIVWRWKRCIKRGSVPLGPLRKRWPEVAEKIDERIKKEIENAGE